MVHATTIDRATAYECEECGLHFQDKSTAERCEAWCSEHESCNLPIASKSIEAQQQRARREKPTHTS